MAARQLPPGGGAAAADPRGRAAALLRAPAEAGGGAAGRPAARLRDRLGLRRAHRQRAQQDAVHRLPRCLPGHRRTHARRTVGAADHAAGGAAGEPAPGGGEHRREQGGARGGARRLGRRRFAVGARTRRAVPRAAKPRHAGQLPDPALAAAAGRARRASAGAGQVVRAALSQRPGLDRRVPIGAGRRQPDGRQHHHDAAHDRPGRLGRPDRAGEPLAAGAARAAELRPRERAHAPADHAGDGAGGAQHQEAGTGGGTGGGRTRAAGARVGSRTDGRLPPVRRRPPGTGRRARAGPQRRPRRGAAAPPPARQLAAGALPGGHRQRHVGAAGDRGARPAPQRLARGRLDLGGGPGAARLAAVRSGDRAAAPHRRGIDPGPGPAPARIRRRHSHRAPRAGRGAFDAELDRGQRAAGPAARAALAREPRGAGPVRAAHRLDRCRPGVDARRFAAAGRRPAPDRRAQRDLSRPRHHGALPAAAPAAQLVRNRAAVDGLGAQARQARDAAAPAGRRRRQRLRGASQRQRACRPARCASWWRWRRIR